MKFKAVLLDMNGVIVDDEALHLAAFQQVLEGRGMLLTAEQYQKHFAGKTDQDGFVAYVADSGKTDDIDELMHEKAQAYLRMARDALQPYDGVVDFVKYLADSGVLLALVTSSLRVEAAAVLSSFGLTNYFKTVITADDIQNGKPDPEGYLLGAQALDVDSSECIVIEDAPSGLRAARASGMMCVVVLNTHTREELAGADLYVDKLEPGCLDRIS